MSIKTSATVEDYLDAIYLLERDAEPASGVRLAELLNVTPPTVTNTLKRMARDGLLILDTRKGPQLSEKGRAAAQSVLRRHMLAEWLLAQFLPWASLHEEAHKLEHAISPLVEEALFNKLNSPKFCPHGNPMPGNEPAVTTWVPLTQTGAGDVLIMRRVHEFAEDIAGILTYLEENRIVPGQKVTINQILPFNQTVNVAVDGREVSLGFTIAHFVYGEIVSRGHSKLNET